MKKIVYVLAVLLTFVVSSCDKEDPEENTIDGCEMDVLQVDVSGLEVCEQSESHTLIGDLPSTGGELRISFSPETNIPATSFPNVIGVVIDNIQQEYIPVQWGDIIEQEGAISKEVEEVLSNTPTYLKGYRKYIGNWGSIYTDFTSLPIIIVVKIEENKSHESRVIRFGLLYTNLYRGFELIQAPTEE